VRLSRHFGLSCVESMPKPTHSTYLALPHSRFMAAMTVVLGWQVVGWSRAHGLRVIISFIDNWSPVDSKMAVRDSVLS